MKKATSTISAVGRNLDASLSTALELERMTVVRCAGCVCRVYAVRLKGKNSDWTVSLAVSGSHGADVSQPDSSMQPGNFYFACTMLSVLVVCH